MQVIAVANQKGGVGKTTVAVNLGAALAGMGFKVALIDLDAQANATQVLYHHLEETERGICEVLLDEGLVDEILVHTQVNGLMLAPAGESLANADINLVSMIGRELVLRNALKGPIVKEFDFILIDTAPYLGLLTVNALVVADYVLVPVSCEFLPLLGLKFLLETVDKIRHKLHPELEVLGFILTMYDRREKITFQVEKLLQERFGNLMFDTRIRVNTKQKGAPAQRATIFEYERSRSGKGTEDFTGLAEEVLSRLKGGLQDGK